MQFRSGEFQTFRATREFGLADKAKILKGTEVLFDGNTVQYGESRFTAPQMIGAIKVGWLVEGDQYNADIAVPIQSANIRVGKGKQSLLVTEADEQVVGQHTDHAKATRAINGFEVQDHQEVGRKFQTPTHNKSKVSSNSIETANRPKPIEAKRGITRDEMLDRMTPEQRQDYLNSLNQHRKITEVVQDGVTLKNTNGVTGKPYMVQNGDSEVEIAVVNTVKTGSRVVEQEGIRFRQEGIVEKSEKPNAYEIKKRTQFLLGLAQTIYPEFPEDYFDGLIEHEKITMLDSLASEFPSAIKAAWAVEDVKVKTLLEHRYHDQLFV